MAKYRQVHTKIWKDEWFAELEPLHKLFFVYLFTNELASISGLYKLSLRVMSFESGLSQDDIRKAFDVFSSSEKAFYDYDESIVMIPSLRKYHETKSPKIQTLIKKDVDDVKDCYLKDKYAKLYGIDRVSDTVSDTVYIPRSSSSSSSSIRSSSNGDGNKEVHEIPSGINTLQSTFESLTGFFPPHETTDQYKDKWLAPLMAIISQSKDEAEAVARIEYAVNASRNSEKKYIISSPKSIMTWALSYQAPEVTYGATTNSDGSYNV